MDCIIFIKECLGIIIPSLLAWYGIKRYNDQKLFDEKLRVYSSYLSIIAHATLSADKQSEYQLPVKYILAK